MNIEKLREDFPVMQKNIIYFDSACMSLRPRQVIDKICEYYNNFSSCSGRSSHKLSKAVDEEIDKVRRLVSKFICADSTDEIIFTKNTTEGINLISNSLDWKTALISSREHNSNLLPWISKGRKVFVVDETKDFEFDLEDFKRKIKGVDIVSVVYKSNVDGYILPVKEIIKIAHDNNALVLLDSAQAVPHFSINVKKLGVDFMAFSSHKMLGPCGLGILYVKREHLSKLKSFILGGGTVYDSTYNSFKFEEGHKKFEAGLQNYSGIFGLGAAIEYLNKVGMNTIEKYTNELGRYLFNRLSELGVEFVGVKDYNKCGGIVNFNIEKSNSHEVALMLDSGYNISVRSGAHCVHSWYNKNGIEGSVRASLYFYNTRAEVDKFVDAVAKIKKMLK
jgi:cysteine desulfurase/selenocysteine lyase